MIQDWIILINSAHPLGVQSLEAGIDTQFCVVFMIQRCGLHTANLMSLRTKIANIIIFKYNPCIILTYRCENLIKPSVTN